MEIQDRDLKIKLYRSSNIKTNRHKIVLNYK